MASKVTGWSDIPPYTSESLFLEKICPPKVDNARGGNTGASLDNRSPNLIQPFSGGWTY
jgi:hypothetical protein